MHGQAYTFQSLPTNVIKRKRKIRSKHPEPGGFGIATLVLQFLIRILIKHNFEKYLNIFTRQIAFSISVARLKQKIILFGPQYELMVHPRVSTPKGVRYSNQASKLKSIEGPSSRQFQLVVQECRTVLEPTEWPQRVQLGPWTALFPYSLILKVNNIKLSQSRISANSRLDNPAIGYPAVKIIPRWVRSGYRISGRYNHIALGQIIRLSVSGRYNHIALVR